MRRHLSVLNTTLHECNDELEIEKRMELVLNAVWSFVDRWNGRTLSRCGECAWCLEQAAAEAAVAEADRKVSEAWLDGKPGNVEE